MAKESFSVGNEKKWKGHYTNERWQRKLGDKNARLKKGKGSKE